jgi:hypothetical protein
MIASGFSWPSTTFVCRRGVDLVEVDRRRGGIEAVNSEVSGGAGGTRTLKALQIGRDLISAPEDGDVAEAVVPDPSTR